MNKSLMVHYMNKYPGADVSFSESGLRVSKNGELLVALAKNGAGQHVCVSKEMGARDLHDLAPIPKDARVMKLNKDGSISKDDEAEKRIEARKKFIEAGRVMSCDELEQKKMYRFSKDGRVAEDLRPKNEEKKLKNLRK